MWAAISPIENWGLRMTATALHPSEITFTCPPWCVRTRESHLEDLSEHEGRVIHASADVEGAGWVVSLGSITFPDGTLPSDEDGVQVEIDAHCLFLSPLEVSRLVQALITATAEAQR